MTIPANNPVMTPPPSRGQGGVFSQFLRHAAPNPTPGKWEFYLNEFKANYSRSQKESNRQYIETLKSDWKAPIKLAMLSTLAGLGFTAFKRLKRTFSYIFMLGMLGYPIMSALRTFPKLGEAYEQVKAGNPTQGRETFRKAMDESIYSIFQDFFKPLTLGMAIALVLSMPGALLRNEGGTIQNITKRVVDFLRIRRDNWVIRGLDKIAGPVTRWGDRVSNHIRDKVRLIEYIENS